MYVHKHGLDILIMDLAIIIYRMKMEIDRFTFVPTGMYVTQTIPYRRKIWWEIKFGSLIGNPFPNNQI